MRHVGATRRTIARAASRGACVILWIGIALLTATAVVARPIHDSSGSRIGLRDRFAIGISLGTRTGFCADIRPLVFDGWAFAFEAHYGAEMAWWGISESYGAVLRLDIPVADNGYRDAFVLAPGVGAFRAYGSRARNPWVDFSPYETVDAATAQLGFSWIHQYASWTLHLSLVPGEAYAFTGRDNGNNPVKGRYAFQLGLIGMIRF